MEIKICEICGRKFIKNDMIKFKTLDINFSDPIYTEKQYIKDFTKHRIYELCNFCYYNFCKLILKIDNERQRIIEKTIMEKDILLNDNIKIERRLK